MRRRRRKRAGGGSTRRRFLAGGLLALGGASILGGTQAFSQARVDRPASVQAAGDQTALLGMDVPDVAAVGVGDAELLALTNNADDPLATSIDVAGLGESESVEPQGASLDPGASVVATASLDADRATSGEPVTVDVTASSPDVDVELTRTVPVPSFSWQVIDNSQYGNVRFDVSFDVGGVPSLDTVTIGVTNTETGGSATYTRSTPGGTVTYPRQGTEGGAGGDEYVLTFDVDDGQGLVLSEQVSVTGGESAGEGDPGNEDDPVLDWIYVDDLSAPSTSDVDYAVYYQVSNLANVGEVEVSFDHENDWASGSVTTTQAPCGMVQHADGNTGDDFEITVHVTNDVGAVVDSANRSDTADGENPTNPHVAEADSPSFASLDVADDSSTGGATFGVTYAIENDERFGEVRAQFENLDGHPETNETITDATGSFTYSTGYTGGEEYRITARVFEDRDGVLVPVDTRVITDVADGQDP